WVAAGNAGTGAWCYYENNSANGPIFGKLYNWYAVTDPRGLAPEGWHVPTLDEWHTLNACLFSSNRDAGALKSVGTIEDATGLWHAPNTGATNSSGFIGLPGGVRAIEFGMFGTEGNFWSTTA